MPRKGRKRRAAELREKLKTEKLREEPKSSSSEPKKSVNEWTVLSGSIHQGDIRFQYPGIQCTFISFYALISMLDNPPKVWTFEDIDACVIEGNNRFIQHCNAMKTDPKMLLAKELPEIMSKGDRTFTCSQLDTEIKFGVLDTVTENKESGMNTFAEAMILAFTRFNSCLLFCGGLTVALARSESMFYIFDPHSRGKDGLLHPQGSAVLVCFSCIRETIRFLEKLFIQSLRVTSGEQFELVPFIISRLKSKSHLAPSSIHDECNNGRNELSENEIPEPTSVSSTTSEMVNPTIVTPTKSDMVNPMQKNANDLSEEAVKTYFEDQYKRDEAYKKRNDISKTNTVPANRNEYMKNYMRNIRKTQSSKTEQKQVRHREQSAKGMRKIRSTSEGRAKNRESTCKSMKSIRETIEGQLKNRETAAKAMKRKRATSEGLTKNRESGCKSMKRIRNTIEGQLKNRETAVKAMKRKRSTSEGLEKNREAGCKSMKRLRNTTEGQLKNRETAAKAMKRKRCTFEGQAKNRESGCKSMKRIRNTTEGQLKNRETAVKAMRRKRSTYEGQAKSRESGCKSMKRIRNSSEGVQRKKRKRAPVFAEAVDKFNETISGLCSYVCSCCQQLWFKHSVKNVPSLFASTALDINLLQRCLTGYKSEEGMEWICSTCLGNIRNKKIPKLSVLNGMKFAKKPPELNLNNLEERLISLRIPFMQIRSLNSGGQLSLKGSVVNVPADIEPTLRALPRMHHESQTVPVKLKRMKDFKHAVQTENVRPVVVMKALQSLLNTSELYKQANLKIDTDWNEGSTDDETIDPYSTKSDDESDNFSEVDEDDNMPVMTFLDEQTQDRNEVLSVAPGEGQRPLSVFKDPNSEYLSFPTIFCGEKRIENEERLVPVYYSDICKWELRSVDRRVALNVPNIFFKMKKTTNRASMQQGSPSNSSMQNKRQTLFSRIYSEGQYGRESSEVRRRLSDISDYTKFSPILGKPKEGSICHDQTAWDSNFIYVFQCKRFELV